VKLRASDLANAIGGRLVGPDTEIDGATFDSRQVLRHQLFVPIVAERDGLASKPAADMFAAGAVALGIDPARAVAVEDATSGAASAAADAAAAKGRRTFGRGSCSVDRRRARDARP
jgi:beta-phosphoglucomutase-like phosphatase (HAD superfamily)